MTGLTLTDEILAITLIWGFVFIYAVMGSMDFGAGFWSMIYINRKKTNATNIANRYLSPTWEVSNVFIVALVVAIYSMFPRAAYSLGTILLVPGSLILLLLAIRSAFLVFSHTAEKYKRHLVYVSGISGIIIPALLMAVLPISQGGYVIEVDGRESLSLARLFTSPNVYAFMAFAISSSLFLSSLLLADYSKTSDDMRAYDVYKRDAIITGPLSLISAFFIMFTLEREASWIFSEMMKNVPLLIASAICFLLAGIALIIPGKKGTRGIPRVAVVIAIVQYLLASYVYGQAHLPYIVYPNVTIQSGFTDPNSFRAVFIVYVVGFAILFPGFYYFWSLFMKNKSLQQSEE
ncbi:cytochrome d ubiquinol oxidase subunit II [Peribacillus deserti]|uniref:Cytochrome d ubiquinol oxidase subunit II n=1 Tax=Peribacillus deserti TaxID=673318 RepID=A0ABS2QE50_9BACI|nr:cytochrome d ubiquinol oxidase subunit II [Peribacillus deserti]MBM7691362.1 cytochrome d ubiquinol oxidase subunit II [Peribacillus deserti]